MTLESKINEVVEKQNRLLDFFEEEIKVKTKYLALHDLYFDIVINDKAKRSTPGGPRVVTGFEEAQSEIRRLRGENILGQRASVLVADFTWEDTVKLSESNVTFKMSPRVLIRSREKKPLFSAGEGVENIVIDSGFYDLPADSRDSFVSKSSIGVNYVVNYTSVNQALNGDDGWNIANF